MPDRPLTDGHLALVDRRPTPPIDVGAAAGLLDAYRRTRAALREVVGHRGFMLSFAERWRPDEQAVGEPLPLGGADRVIHVFGRGAQGGPGSPVQLLAVPAEQRRAFDVTP